jgi:hypothetical protein
MKKVVFFNLLFGLVIIHQQFKIMALFGIKFKKSGELQNELR